MSKSIDERVVQMGFENKEFESNAKTTMNTLDKLKQSLNFKGASKGLEEVNKASKNMNFSALASSLEMISSRFTTLGVIGTTALQNITNRAINTARNLINELSFAPIMEGFREYETQIGAIQTILANTSAQGTTLEQVTAALDELNLYADQTIYNFTEMTRNIGTFTAAGVDLKTSTEAIKGIANLAAMSGSTSTQASTAMYQLSQALAAGRVSLQDWNSVVNAGMGGKVFQEALMQTAEAMGIVVDRTQSFRESISATGGQASWLTSEVLLNTLRQFTGDLTDAELAAMGFNEEQVKAIQAQAKTANEAATQVKTLTQLIDTMKESVTSGWTETWEILIGDFGEAKSLFTNISNVFGDFVSNMSNARNDLLSGGLMSGWKQFLNEGISNQDDFLGSVREAMDAYGYYEGFLDDLITTHGSFDESLKSGWMTTDILADSVARYTERLNGMSEEELETAGYTGKHVEELNKLNEEIQNGTVNLDEFLTKMTRSSGRENIIEGLNQAFRTLLEVIAPVKQAFDEVFDALQPEELYEATVSFKNFFTNLSLGEKNAENLKRTFKGLFSIIDMFSRGFSTIFSSIFGFAPEVGNLASKFLELTAAIGDWFTELNQSSKVNGLFTAVSDAITSGLDEIFGLLYGITNGLSGAQGAFKTFGDFVSSVFDNVFSVVGKVFSWIKSNISAGDIFAGLAGGGLFMLFKKLGSLVDKIKDIFEAFSGDKKENLKNNISEVLDSIKGSLESFQQGVQVASIIGIAIAVTMLVSSVKKLSEIDPIKIAVSLGSIKLLIMSLNSGFSSLQSSLSKFKTKGAIGASLAMIAMAKGVDILADAVTKIADLNFGQLLTGLAGVGGLLAELALAMNLLSMKSQVNLRSSVAILALSVACEKLSEAIIPLSKLSWSEIQKGLVAMGGALGEFTASMAILGKFGGMGSILGATGILIASQSLYAIAENLETLGSMSWDSIQKGLTSMGVALTEFTAALGALSFVGGMGSLLGATGILIASQSLYAIAENLKVLGSMSWDSIQKGLTSMGVALAEFTVALGALSFVGGFGAILGGVAILITSQSLRTIAENLQVLGSMTWEEIGRGLAAMGGALAEIATVSGALGYLAGIGAIIGAGSILLAVQGLEQLANSFASFGSMSWEEIKRGLVGMGGALAEVAVVSGALGSLTGIAGLVGAGTLTLAISGLDELANAFSKFASMSWEEIGRGLSAMGAALSETALGGLANTFSGLGALSIKTLVEPLGQLADSVQNWADVKVPDDIFLQLQRLGSGVNTFMFSGSSANSIATLAIPIGDLADSMKKWADVSVPKDIFTQLQSLGSGINSFMFSGWGAESLATFAIPLGDLADSVKKWAGVELPENLGTKIGSLAYGIDAFTLSGWGADNLSKVAPGIGDLAGAVKKWEDVALPENLGGQLESLANGVKAFTFAFFGGITIENISEPLGILAGSVSKWSDVTVPEGLEADLTSLANGISSFGGAFIGGWSVNQITAPLGELADSVKKWSGIDISNVGPQLTSLSAGVKAFADCGIGEYTVDAFGSLVDTLSSDSFAMIAQNIDLFSTSIQKLSTIDASSASGLTAFFEQFSSISATSILSSFTSSMSAIMPNFQMIAMQICNTLIMGFTSQLPRFMQIGVQYGMQITMGLTSQTPNASNAARTLGNSALFQLQGLNASFKVAGQNAGAGFVQGLQEYVAKAAEAAAQMAQQAVDAANQALDAHSPSRKMKQSGIWGGEGLVLGFESMYGAVRMASYKLGDSAVESLSNAISKARSVMNSSAEVEPTIRPVVDLSDVKAKAALINSEFSANRRFSIGFTSSKIASASSGMTVRQNGDVRGDDSQTNQSSAQTFNFTQNNYSPKALSRSEIYRDTKNQFSMIKGVVSSK